MYVLLIQTIIQLINGFTRASRPAMPSERFKPTTPVHFAFIQNRQYLPVWEWILLGCDGACIGGVTVWLQPGWEGLVEDPAQTQQTAATQHTLPVITPTISHTAGSKQTTDYSSMCHTGKQTTGYSMCHTGKQTTGYSSMWHTGKQTTGYSSMCHTGKQTSGYSMCHTGKQTTGYSSMWHNGKQTTGYSSMWHNGKQTTGYSMCHTGKQTTGYSSMWHNGK